MRGAWDEGSFGALGGARALQHAGPDTDRVDHDRRHQYKEDCGYRGVQTVVEDLRGHGVLTRSPRVRAASTAALPATSH